MRQKIQKKHSATVKGGRTRSIPGTFETMASCSGATGIPLAVLKDAKRAGCPAFVFHRVELVPLLTWLFQQKPEESEDWEARLLAAQAKIEELDLEERQKSLVPMETARKVLHDVLLPLKTEMLSAPATLSSRCNPGDPEIARIALNDWTRQTLETVANAVSRV